MSSSFKQRYPTLPLKYMFQIFEIAGVPILVHLSTFIFLGFFTVLALFWGWPFLVLALLCLALIFFHELGHYYVAQHYGYRCHGIFLFPFLGICFFDEPEFLIEEIAIAWAGIGVQFFWLLIAAIIFYTWSEPPTLIRLFLFIFGFANILVIFMNLIPVSLLDGKKAWKIIPYWRESWRG